MEMMEKEGQSGPLLFSVLAVVKVSSLQQMLYKNVRNEPASGDLQLALKLAEVYVAAFSTYVPCLMFLICPDQN